MKYEQHTVEVDDDCAVMVGLIVTRPQGRPRFVSIAIDESGEKGEDLWLRPDEARAVAQSLIEMADRADVR